MKPLVITLKEGIIGGFIDDKDRAREIRVQTIMPEIENGRHVIIDFKNVQTSTQSFVHALLGEVLGKFKEPVLEQLEFRHCSPQLKTLIELVVDYSLGGFLPSEDENTISNRISNHENG